ncbi:MAG: hypothetical protein J4N79_01710 [Chloroflexi bacterium]|nr:hypothetical protein [Chloroflexota bacterium]
MERPDHDPAGTKVEGNKVLYLKACPKCHGDIELVVYSDSKTLQCLQCAFTVDSKVSARRAMSEKAQATTAAA